MENIAIFASGSGTNAENIVRTFAGGNRIRVAVAVTDRKDAGVIGRMEALDIPVLYFPGKVWKEEPQQIVEALKPYDIDLVVLAGFLRKVADPIIEAYPGRMLNIHPSLLPAYSGKGMYGHHVHEAVIAAGEKQSGVTVHKVTSDLDSGEIVMQGILDIEPGETPETLEAKIHDIEYALYPRAIAKTLKDLSASASRDGHNPPAIPRVPTPDEQWAEALHVPYAPAPDETAAHHESTPPQIAPTPIPDTGAVPDAQPAAPVNPKYRHLTKLQPKRSNEEPEEKEDLTRPAKSYLALSIIFLILFGLFPAVIAIVYSCKVRRLNSIGDYVGSHKASKVCQGWLIATFCFGVLLMTMAFPIMMALLAA